MEVPQVVAGTSTLFYEREGSVPLFSTIFDSNEIYIYIVIVPNKDQRETLAGTDFGIDPSRGCNLVNGCERDRSSKKDSANCPVTFPSSPPSHRPAHSTDFRALFPGQESTFPSPNKLELHTSFSLGKKKKKKKRTRHVRSDTRRGTLSTLVRATDEERKKGRKEFESPGRGEENFCVELDRPGRRGGAEGRCREGARRVGSRRRSTNERVCGHVVLDRRRTAH